jgi:hypothetical protein
MDTHVGHVDPVGDERNAARDINDFVHTGPGTPAGRYLRRFWQPIICRTISKPSIPLCTSGL